MSTHSFELPPAKEYAPYQPGPFRLAMDLHPLNLAEWIEVDEHLPAELVEKQRLLAERYSEVFAALPEAAAGAAETLALLVDHLPARFPQVYQLEGDRLHNRATAETWPLAGGRMHPLELAGRLVQEDLCLMGRDPASGLYRLTGACLCFPSRWRLAEKLGKPLDAIHGPVPGYAAALGAPMNRLFERLKSHKPVWRLNWSVVDDPALFQPIAPAGPDYATNVTAANAGDKLWLRLERQTLRRLAASNDILFTIRIYSRPLSVLAGQPERAAQLAAAIRGLNEEMRLYKSMRPIIGAALAWLDRTAAAGCG